MIDPHARQMAEESKYFAECLTSGISDEEILDRYLTMRAVNAAAMRSFTDRLLETDAWELDSFVERIGAEMRSRLAGIVPLDTVCDPRVSKTHRKLFEYLSKHQGEPIPIAKLRALTGDQVHTERRVRELRALGLRIDAVATSGGNSYCLSDTSIDFDVAFSRLIGGIIDGVPNWSAAQKSQVKKLLTET